jgi:hypothetical protein
VSKGTKERLCRVKNLNQRLEVNRIQRPRVHIFERFCLNCEWSLAE